MDNTLISKRQRLSPDSRRAQLLEYAIHAYAQLGIERAGHGDVAKLAGVSTATVFNYFPTREALSEAVFEFLRVQIMLFLDNLPPTVVTASDCIRYFAIGYDAMADAHPDLMKVSLNWSASFSPNTRPQFLEFQKKIIAKIIEMLPGDSPDHYDARMVLAYADMFAKMKLDNTDPEMIQKFVDRVADAM